MPQMERKRACDEASESTDEKLNSDLLFCKDLGALTEQKHCNIGACSGFILNCMTEYKCSICFQWQHNGKDGVSGLVALFPVEEALDQGREPSFLAGMGQKSSQMAQSPTQNTVEQMNVQVRIRRG